MQTKMESVVKKWLDQKGYGFIANPDDPDDDIMVHHSGVIGHGRKSLRNGQRVRFETFTNDRGRLEARNCLGL